MIKADFGRTWQDGYCLVKITVIKEVKDTTSVASQAAVAQETLEWGREGKQPQTLISRSIFQTDKGLR